MSRRSNSSFTDNLQRARDLVVSGQLSPERYQEGCTLAASLFLEAANHPDSTYLARWPEPAWLPLDGDRLLLVYPGEVALHNPIRVLRLTLGPDTETRVTFFIDGQPIYLLGFQHAPTGALIDWLLYATNTLPPHVGYSDANLTPEDQGPPL